MQEQLTAETQHRLEWRLRHLRWLLPRIAGSDEDKEQFLAMWNEAMEQSFYEGTLEAKALIDLIGEKVESPVSVAFMSEKVGELARLNKRSS